MGVIIANSKWSKQQRVCWLLVVGSSWTFFFCPYSLILNLISLLKTSQLTANVPKTSQRWIVLDEILATAFPSLRKVHCRQIPFKTSPSQYFPCYKQTNGVTKTNATITDHILIKSKIDSPLHSGIATWSLCCVLLIKN